MKRYVLPSLTIIFLLSFFTLSVHAQGVTTASLNGTVTDTEGEALPSANVILVHEASGTRYGVTTLANGRFNLPNLKIGGPYTISVSYVGYSPQKQENIYLSLGQNLRIDFALQSETVKLGEVVISAEQDKVLNSGRTGAATYIDPLQVQQMPSIKRSTRDYTRLDPRSDGNFSFGGKNWLYNNISLDGSYFNNPFGLDDPAPGGQTNAEPVPFDAVEQVQVSIAPFDVREGGFTGAGINTVTKSGTNQYKASLYTFMRNENLVGNTVSGKEVIANPDLSYNQSGFTSSGAIVPNKLFFFINGEIDRRKDPGTNFIADRDGNVVFGESRVSSAVMDQIRQRMIDVYGYDPGPYENYTHETNNEKLLIKLDWNIDENNKLSFRYNRLDARRDLPPHPFVLSFNGTGRGPNENTLPFKNAGYRINNRLNSFAAELNSYTSQFANRFFVSYNRFRDYRDPFSKPFPTVQIGEAGVAYTTLGHEPFSIHNILDQDVWQFTNNLSYNLEDHFITVGATFEYFSFFNSFNIFRHGLFFLPYFLDFEGDGIPNGSTFSSLDEFFAQTDPSNPIKLNQMVGTGPFKGENIEVGQFAIYAQDEFLVSKQFSLTFGVRVDMPVYFTDPVDNPFSRGLTLLDEDDNPETIDQSKLPGIKPLFSPRVGFNWDINGDRTTQLRGGTGIFTGRIPFVWYGNVISNPGANPNLYPAGKQITSKGDAILQQSFDLNGMTDDFVWPQVWTTNLAVDHKLPWDILGTLEFIYGKDINAIYVRNADLGKPVRYLPDGRPYFRDANGNNELNPDGGAGAYVIDNASEGYNYNITAQLRKRFDFGMNASFSYSYTKAKSLMKSTEIASVLWSENPTQGDPNKPELSYSEFGQRHRFVGAASYRFEWEENFATSIGVFFEIAEGGRFIGAGGNRYSFVYSGDVNGDGSGGNDLIYIPRNQSEIVFEPYIENGTTVSAQAQWNAFNKFIEQDDYLSSNRGKIAERFGAVNPWYFNLDLRILQDYSFMIGQSTHTFQLSIDILNFPNLINSDWGVRQTANSAATSPLQLVKFNDAGAPVFKYQGTAKETYTDDVSLNSRWQMQVGLRYLFN
ncbi:MAG: TonB-dependent receptor [Ignavibacteriales bacterium]|nr:TonB-dependent receptor [Ignavibacteriales bacterium]